MKNSKSYKTWIFHPISVQLRKQNTYKLYKIPIDIMNMNELG